MADSPVKYVYQSPNEPRKRPTKLAKVTQIGSYIATALIFLMIGLFLGRNLTSTQNSGSELSANQSLLIIEAVKTSAPSRDEQITITDTGQAVYRNNQTGDELETQIPPDVLTMIQSHIVSSNFFSLNEHYTTGCGNCLTYKATLRIGDNTKGVEAEWGQIKQPSELAPLFNLFETIIAQIKRNQPQ
jgi:hypothetical protein